MSKNGRNKKGQFKCGNPGGPGRPAKKKVVVDENAPLLDQAYQVTKELITSKDERTRVQAVRLATVLEKMKGPRSERAVLHPRVRMVLGALIEGEGDCEQQD